MSIGRVHSKEITTRAGVRVISALDFNIQHVRERHHEFKCKGVKEGETETKCDVGEIV